MRFEIWGKQSHLSRWTYGGWDIASKEWWRCFRLPGGEWLWVFF